MMRAVYTFLATSFVAGCGLQPARLYPETGALTEGPRPPLTPPIVVAAVTAVPAPDGAMVDERSEGPAVTKRKLSNGVPVYATPRDASPTGTILVVVGTKNLPVPPAVAGIYAQAALHGRPLPWSTVEYEGARLFTAGGEDFVALGVSALAPSFADVVGRVLPNVVTASLWDIDVDRAKEALASEASHFEGDRLALRTALAGLFPAPHPYGASTVAGIGEYRSVAVKDVRAFRDAQLAADNVAIVVSGHVDVDALLPVLERGLEKLPTKSSTGVSVSTPPATCKGNVIVHDRPGRPQASVAIAFPAVPAESDDTAPLDVVAAAMGPSVSLNGRLQRALRHELRLTYGVGGRLRAFREGGALVLELAVENGRVSEALARIEAELDALGREPLDPDELAFAKIRANHAVQTDDDQGPALRLAATIASHRPFSWPKLKAVTAADVQSAARRYLRREARCIAIVGDPAIANEPELASGKFGAIVRQR